MPGRSSPPVTVAFFAGKTPARPVYQTIVSSPYPANESNTGYQNAPGYPGSLTTWPGGALNDNTTYSFYNFSSSSTTNSLISTGSYTSGSNAVNVTFTGCRFASNNILGEAVVVPGSGITFNYCTFEPSTVAQGSEPAISNASYGIAQTSGYQFAVNQVNSNGPFIMNHCRIWGFANATQMSTSSVVSPVKLTYCLFQNPRADGSAGGGDHTDGPGVLNGGITFNGFVMDHCTVIGIGNTNALALQPAVVAGSPTTFFNNCTITSNYFAGFGNMVAIGIDTRDVTNTTFSGNVWGSDLEPGGVNNVGGGGPLYSAPGAFGSGAHSGFGNLWSNNKISTYAGTSWMNAGNNGLYWWPTDGDPSDPTQVVGHASDYVNT